VGLPCISQSAVPLIFIRGCPIPLGHLLKELNVMDGTDVSLLCDFLLKVLKIRQVGQMADYTIYETIYPCYRGELLALVTNVITAAESFEIFYARILEQFVPVRKLSQLRTGKY
jgi:hypothetical protein